MQNRDEIIEYQSLHDEQYQTGFYLNGLRHGEAKWFYPDGSLEQHCFYLKGMLHGESKWFYEDGSLEQHGFYLNGSLHGEFKEYYQNGSLEEHCFYLNNIKQTQLDYLTTERDEVTLTLLFGDNYENIQYIQKSNGILKTKPN